MDEDPDGRPRSWPGVAETSVDEYESLAEGTTLFTAEQALDAFQAGDDTTSLTYTAS